MKTNGKVLISSQAKLWYIQFRWKLLLPAFFGICKKREKNIKNLESYNDLLL